MRKIIKYGVLLMLPLQISMDNCTNNMIASLIKCNQFILENNNGVKNTFISLGTNEFFQCCLRKVLIDECFKIANHTVNVMVKAQDLIIHRTTIIDNYHTVDDYYGLYWVLGIFLLLLFICICSIIIESSYNVRY